MSYDVGFYIDTGGEGLAAVGPDNLNHTYNCGAMFRLALGGDGINDLDGQVAGDMIDRLSAAVRHIADPALAETYAAMNPPNKWGSHETATEFLRLILRGAQEHPKTTIRVF